MNFTEAKAVLDLVRSVCPAQKFGDSPEEIWHLVLEDVSAVDALKAVTLLARERPFIATADICRKVEELHSRNLATSVRPMPDVDPDLSREYQAEIARLDGMIASGVVRTHLPELSAHAATPPNDDVIAAKAALTGQDERFLRRRALANTIECERPGCNAQAGTSCHLDGVTLTRSEAHHERLARVGLVATHVPPSAERVAAALARDGGGE